MRLSLREVPPGARDHPKGQEVRVNYGKQTGIRTVRGSNMAQGTEKNVAEQEGRECQVTQEPPEGAMPPTCEPEGTWADAIEGVYARGATALTLFILDIVPHLRRTPGLRRERQTLSVATAVGNND